MKKRKDVDVRLDPLQDFFKMIQIHVDKVDGGYEVSATERNGIIPLKEDSISVQMDIDIRARIGKKLSTVGRDEVNVELGFYQNEVFPGVKHSYTVTIVPPKNKEFDTSRVNLNAILATEHMEKIIKSYFRPYLVAYLRALLDCETLQNLVVAKKILREVKYISDTNSIRVKGDWLHRFQNGALKQKERVYIDILNRLQQVSYFQCEQDNNDSGINDIIGIDQFARFVKDEREYVVIDLLKRINLRKDLSVKKDLTDAYLKDSQKNLVVDTLSLKYLEKFPRYDEILKNPNARIVICLYKFEPLVLEEGSKDFLHVRVMPKVKALSHLRKPHLLTLVPNVLDEEASMNPIVKGNILYTFYRKHKGVQILKGDELQSLSVELSEELNAVVKELQTEYGITHVDVVQRKIDTIYYNQYGNAYELMEDTMPTPSLYFEDSSIDLILKGNKTI